ncbi:hypothetical protein BUUB107078_07165 [Burkholderia ubonensis]|nr:hypothetical protein BUB20358_03357 [Burkholderia ubonensis]
MFVFDLPRGAVCRTVPSRLLGVRIGIGRQGKVTPAWYPVNTG